MTTRLRSEAYEAAACAQIPTTVADEVFFSTAPSSIAAARAICADCPIADICLADALREEGGTAAFNRFGVRGGLTPVERSQIDPIRRCADCGTPLIHVTAERCDPHRADRRRRYKREWGAAQRLDRKAS